MIMQLLLMLETWDKAMQGSPGLSNVLECMGAPDGTSSSGSLGGMLFAGSTGRTPLLQLHPQGPAEDCSVAAQGLHNSLCPDASIILRQDHKFSLALRMTSCSHHLEAACRG